jgi:succinate dehydrogenase / fumarate reductase, cytochrome b subunit
MAPPDRPLSPHLQIYRWELTMVLSILHRMTGVALSVGLLLLVCWLLAAAAGPEAFEPVQALLGSPLGLLLLFGWTFALFYHLGNGVRHLVWDIGLGLERRQARISGWVVIVFSVLATALAWAVVAFTWPASSS